MRSLERWRAHRGEDGFTLIEMLVAMVLLMIVLIILFAALLDAFRNGERSRQRTKAQRNVTLVSEKLSSDIHAMRAPNRNPKDTTGAELMREAFTVSDRNLQVHDIIVAQPGRLIVFAELHSIDEPTTGATANELDLECIEWVVTQPDQALHRRVYPYSFNCGEAVAGRGAKLDEEVMPKPDAENATRKDFSTIFSYYVTDVDPTAGEELGTCIETHEMQGVQTLGGGAGPDQLEDGETTSDGTGGGGLEQVVVDGLPPQRVDRIVAIEMNLRSLVSVKGSRGEAQFLQKLTIPSRQQYEFRYAIGCAE